MSNLSGKNLFDRPEIQLYKRIEHEVKRNRVNRVELNEYTLSVNLPKPKSKIMIGSNTVIFNDRHFNWFQKKMWKILLGIKIEDVEETNE